ncbi:MAG: TonB-dependent receptor [Opitutae bacterium]|nr:TonB-dependent receptor [Opitutae bacterium]
MNHPSLLSRRSVVAGAYLLRLCAVLLSALTFATAQEPKRTFDLPAADAATALQLFMEQSQLEVIYPSDAVRGVQLPAIKGSYTAREALERLLAGTPLAATQARNGAFAVNRTTATTETGRTAGLVGTGGIEGRVFDAGRGEYLEKVRITVDGTALEVFTDGIGQYRLVDVPAGVMKLRVFYTGLDPHTETVAVDSGKIVQRDITLRAVKPKEGVAGDTIHLAEFVVSTSRRMDAAAMALNEQRFAPNVVSAIAADEFGVVVDGTPGEVLKFLPGVTMEYGAGEARTISLNGVSPAYVPVTVGGFDIAAMASNGTARAVTLDQVSVNNISRIEVLQSPTPESPGSALAGSVNMVPRSAFERSRPEFNYSVFMMMKDSARDFHKTPGPFFNPSRKVTPGLNFSWIVPVTKRFGFTLSGNHNVQVQVEDWSQNYWRGGGNVTNGTTIPHTTPDKPYLTDYRVADSTRLSTADSLSTTIDYKLSNYDRISVSFQYNFLDVEANNRQLYFIAYPITVGNFGVTWAHSDPGKGEIRTSDTARCWMGNTIVSTFMYRHDGKIWKAEAGTGYSTSVLHLRDIDKGYFSAVQARRQNVTVWYDDIYYLQPGRISVFDGTSGAPVDFHVLNNYALNNATSQPTDAIDLKRSAFANLRRDFMLGTVPVGIKAGLDVRQSLRDLTGYTDTYTFRGADGKPSTTPSAPGSDDAAGIVLDDIFSQRTTPFGFGKLQWISNVKYWELYKNNPSYFTTDPNSLYRSVVTRSKHAEETVSSAYIRGDVAFFNRRLKFTGGIRAEQTNINAEGPLTDPTRNFQRDASGKFILGSNGRPLTILPTTDTLGVSRLTYLARGLHAEKEYLRWFPSINVSYNITDNLIARAAYYYSVGRPDYDQYTGGLTLPDLTVQPNTSNATRIQVNNAGIKAWSAKSAKVRLEYYFARGGQLSVGAYLRDFTNLFESTIVAATPEFLSLYGLDPASYGAYEVVTQKNLANVVRMTGVDLAYKQNLLFLPYWARGVQVFANVTAQRSAGDEAGSLDNFIPRTYNWGVGMVREKYSVHMNWNYRGRQRRGPVTPGPSIAPGSFVWGSKRLYVDLTADYKLWKNLAVFASFRNLTNEVQDTQNYNPQTPKVARFGSRGDYAGFWTFGLKGSY